MDVRERISHLVSEVRPLPGGDAEATFRRGRRRVGRRRILAAGGVAVVAAVAAISVAFPDDGLSRLPLIGDAPETVDVDIPNGWQTITAGEIAVSVPPDWEISRPYDTFEPPEGASLGGPCHTDLYQPPRADGDLVPEVPVAVVYDRPTDGACQLIGFSGPPPRPGLVIFETIRGTVDGLEGQPGGERVDIEEHARRDRIGQLEVWRTDAERVSDEDDPGIVAYVAAELTGGIWVSHPDDPIVERILATARPASDAEPRTIEPVSPYRDLPGDAWELLGEGASDHYLGGGKVISDQTELDHLWTELGLEGQAPSLPERTIALAGATYAGGLPGGCHEHRDVVGVRMRGSGANILLGPFAPGQQGRCSDEPIVHVVAVPPELAENVVVVATEPVDEP